MKILIANGPNLDLLGLREPHIYGSQTLDEILLQVKQEGALLSAQLQIEVFQSHWEGAMMDELTRLPWNGIIINPGAWTHTSLAIADRLIGLGIPYCEVHLSCLEKREPFRQKSFFSQGSIGVISGFRGYGYVLALRALYERLQNLGSDNGLQKKSIEPKKIK